MATKKDEEEYVTIDYNSLSPKEMKQVQAWAWGQRFLEFSDGEQVIQPSGMRHFVFRDVEHDEKGRIVRVIADAYFNAKITIKGDFRKGRSKEPFHGE